MQCHPLVMCFSQCCASTVLRLFRSAQHFKSTPSVELGVNQVYSVRRAVLHKVHSVRRLVLHRVHSVRQSFLHQIFSVRRLVLHHVHFVRWVNESLPVGDSIEEGLLVPRANWVRSSTEQGTNRSTGMCNPETAGLQPENWSSFWYPATATFEPSSWTGVTYRSVFRGVRLLCRTRLFPFLPSELAVLSLEVRGFPGCLVLALRDVRLPTSRTLTTASFAFHSFGHREGRKTAIVLDPPRARERSNLIAVLKPSPCHTEYQETGS